MNCKKSILILTAVILSMQSFNGLQAQDYVAPPVRVSTEKVRNSDGKVYYSHVVLEKQTLFSIAKAYGVTVEEIYAVNPELRETGLKTNSILLIPVTGSPAPETQPQTPADKTEEAEKTHTVKWYESIDDIAKTYGVSPESILRRNNITKIKRRMVLVIPSKEEAATYGTVSSTVADNTVVRTEVADKATDVKEEIKERINGFFSSFARKGQADISVLLPFASLDKPSANYLDFYSGVLMAAREAGRNGISTNLEVYDVAGGNLPANSEALRTADVIIGPVSPEDVERTLSSVSPTTMVVSPLNQNVAFMTARHPNLIQAPVSHYSQYRDIVHWMKEDTKGGDRVIVISEKGKNSDAAGSIESILAGSGLHYRNFTYSILEGRVVAESIKAIMTKEGTNRILVNSESESFVYDVVRNLNLLLHSDLNIVMYGTNKIRSFDTIDPIDLHKVNLHASLSYFINYDDPKISRFLLEYRAFFGTEPTQFSFQGYDLADYFIRKSAEGREWKDRLTTDGRTNALQSDFEFIQTEGNGFLNQGVRRVVYEKNFKIRLVK